MIHSRALEWHGRAPKCLLGCSLDPLSLTAIGLAVGGIGAGASAYEASKASSASATAPTPPPDPTAAAPPVQQPIGSQKSGAQGSTPSFVGSAAVPATGYGQKSLLGQ